MHIVRYVERGSGPAVRLGALADGRVAPAPGVDGFADLLALGLDEARQRLADVDLAASRALGDVVLLPPADGLVEVWASGVTYERSMDARAEESGYQDVYTRVYAAKRPELFFKCPSWRVVTGDEPVAVRPDATVTVPEPELALLVTPGGETLGYTVCNDMSSRDIEGENPLYIPQAKTYSGSCALAAAVRPAWEVNDVGALDIRLRVLRGGAVVFSGETNTRKMHRTLDELVGYLTRAMDFPGGAVLATGTGIVPDLDFTLLPGDRVEIVIDQIGELSNPVTTTDSSAGWPHDAVADPFSRMEVRS